jgi:Mn-dependent DtxR family transcriptional regulator
LTHPQRGKAARNAQAPRLPVESDRVRTVLTAIDNAGSLRIKDARDSLKIPHNSMNALMQYLKRKLLVQKTGSARDAPYCLTDKGYEVLEEITRRHAA